MTLVSSRRNLHQSKSTMSSWSNSSSQAKILAENQVWHSVEHNIGLYSVNTVFTLLHTLSVRIEGHGNWIAIVAGIIALLLLLGACLAICWCICRKKSHKRQSAEKKASNSIPQARKSPVNDKASSSRVKSVSVQNTKPNNAASPSTHTRRKKHSAQSPANRRSSKQLSRVGHASKNDSAR
mgnify:CR=1 FL=1